MAVSSGKRPTGHRQADAEHPKTLELVAGRAGAAPTPKVKRRLAAVLATAVTSRATKLAPWAP